MSFGKLFCVLLFRQHRRLLLEADLVDFRPGRLELLIGDHARLFGSAQGRAKGLLLIARRRERLFRCRSRVELCL